MLDNQPNATNQQCDCAAPTTKDSKPIKVVVYGGNGFVGSRVAKALQQKGACVVCVSRRGYKPMHLAGECWSENVRWCKGDASEPDLDLLKSADSIVCAIGSPPIPTFRDQAYKAQYHQNGTSNINAIEAAANCGVKRVVLLGAKIPFFMRTDKFAYYRGKADAKQAAHVFSQHSESQSAVVVEPGVIAGKRYLESGKSLPLDTVFFPFTTLMPWQFVKLDALAERLASEALNFSAEEPYRIISNSAI